MEQYDVDAGTTLTGIYADAESAKSSAESATASAETALTQLTVVENVLGVLDLVSKHGTYDTTRDTEVNPNKWYFTREGTAPDYVYVVVSNPAGDPSTQGWYELTGIDEAIQNYVSNQLYLDNAGLWLKTAGMNTKILLSTAGVVIHGVDGQPVASYGSTAVIGNANGFHIEIDNQEIGFYQGANRVAYMNGSELYVKNSLSFGSFSFTKRQTGHFTLKLLD